MKDMFLFIHFFLLALVTLFSLHEAQIKVELRINSYKRDIDLMVVLCTFFTSDNFDGFYNISNEHFLKIYRTIE